MIYLVKAKSKWGGAEFTGIADTEVETIQYFKDWLEKRGLTPRSFWFADVYNLGTVDSPSSNPTFMGELHLLDNGDVVIDIDVNGRAWTLRDTFRRILRRFGIG